MGWNPYDDSPAPPQLEPAPLGPRLAAGAIDLAAVVVLGTGATVLPLRLGAPSAPFLCGLLIVLGWNVAPLAAFQATFGMRLMSLELVQRDGEPLEVGPVLAREMLGRGFLGLIYLSTLVGTLAAAIAGRVSVAMLAGPSRLGVALALSLVVVAALGHLAALGQPQGRTLADRMARSVVIPRRPRARTLHPDDQREVDRRSARRFRTVVIFEVVLVTLAFGGPLVLARLASTRPDVSRTERIAREVREQRLQARFDAEPSNAEIARELERVLAEQGKLDQAARIQERHEQARQAVEAARERALEARLAADPRDRDAAGELVSLHVEAGRKEEARSAYAAFAAASPDPETQVGYGVWLYRHDYTAEAVRILEAHAPASSQPVAWAYLGWAYLELGRKADGQKALARAVEGDPSLEQARRDLEALDRELGPLPRGKKPGRALRR